jgi:hypothetical protein
LSPSINPKWVLSMEYRDDECVFVICLSVTIISSFILLILSKQQHNGNNTSPETVHHKTFQMPHQLHFYVTDKNYWDVGLLVKVQNLNKKNTGQQQFPVKLLLFHVSSHFFAAHNDNTVDSRDSHKANDSNYNASPIR